MSETSIETFKPGDRVRLTAHHIEMLKDAGVYVTGVDDGEFVIEKHVHGDVYQFNTRRLMHARNMRKI